MHEDGQKLLNLMFKPDESVCVSNSKFGYHSIALEDVLQGEITLIPPLKSDKPWQEQAVYCNSDQLTLVALNPIEGFRRDNNTKAYRNFLIELDIGTIEEQIGYIKRSGLPYSAMIFSGNKSIHTLISLEKDLSDEKTYRKTAQWILNILPLADQNIKNPSRSIRIPGAEREPGKFQKLLEFKGQITIRDLSDWLNKHPSSMPRERVKREVSDSPDLSRMKPWAVKMLKNGFPAGLGRNSGWFQLSCEAYICGLSEEETVNKFQQYFQEESDFKEKEWLSAINSAFKYMAEK